MERQRRNLLARDVAGKAGIHPVALSRIERGVQGDVGIATIAKIADAMNMTASAIVAHAESDQKPEAG